MTDARGGKPVTLSTLRRMAEDGEKFAMLTCYDATTAGHLAAAGVETLLVGDSAAQVILGFDRSIHAPLEFMLRITAAVKRGAPACFVMGDMPFMSYQAEVAEGVRNAGRFMTEGLADAVKLEVGPGDAALVQRMSDAGVPVVAHIGWRPQRSSREGVRTAKIAGRTAREAEALRDVAELMESRGAAMLLIEQCPAEAAAFVKRHVGVPVIGCGAGPACDGHVVVLQDLLGMSERSPSFAPRLADGGSWLREAAGQWAEMVHNGSYGVEHPYGMAPGEAGKLTG
jgi:3-methyl-2-oxobutanoate hydroxymethyltransferase